MAGLVHGLGYGVCMVQSKGEDEENNNVKKAYSYMHTMPYHIMLLAEGVSVRSTVNEMANGVKQIEKREKYGRNVIVSSAPKCI